MELLTYSSDDCSELNSARRALWSSKYMLGMANKEPGKYEGKGFWMKEINRDRAELRRVAKRLKSVLMPDPTKGDRVFYVTLTASVYQARVKVCADTRGEAIHKCAKLYKGFNIIDAQEVK